MASADSCDEAAVGSDWLSVWDIGPAVCGVGLMKVLDDGTVGEIVIASADRCCIPFAWPERIGMVMVARVAAVSRSFLLRVSFRVACLSKMSTMRFLRSAPVTPETQGSGDST